MSGLLRLLGAWMRPSTPSGPPSACAACGEDVRGPSLQALGKTWHPGHFRCAICGLPLQGDFWIGPHGEPFCRSHPTTGSICGACGHLLPAPALGGAYCPDCSLTGMVQEGAASRLMGEIQGAFRRMGFPWWPQGFPLRLAAPGELSLGSGAPSRPPSGLIRHVTHRHPGGRIGREVTEILLERGLPSILAGQVLAHELGHAWLFQQGGPKPPDLVEEGFCELCSVLWLRTLRDPRAPYLIGRISRNEDPVYGAGYRRVAGFERNHGLATLLDAMRRGVWP